MYRIDYYLKGTRIFEWVMSIPVVCVSLMVLIWPRITEAPAFRLFAWAIPTNLIGVTMLMCGVACVVALLINGSSLKIGPRIRSWTALARSVLWLQFALSTLQASIEQGYPYTVLPFWFTFVIAELWVAYRAVLDVRIPR